MSRLNLSNLHVRPNLLSAKHYQQEMMKCSVFELRDIKERNPNLFDGMPLSKQEEWRESLFWGKRPPPIDPAWAEKLASGLSEAVRDLEERPTLEAAFECLILARQLHHTRSDGSARTAAAEWDRRVCVVLALDEFRHTHDMIDQRLESVLGYPLTGPPRPEVTSVEPPVRPAVAAVRPRQPALFLVATDAKAESAPEPPAVLLSSPVKREIPPPIWLAPLAAESPPPPPRVEVAPHRATPATAPPEKLADSRLTPAIPPRATTTLTVRDSDLKRLVQRWATLPDHVKKCVMMLLDAAEATQNTSNE